MVMEPDMLTCSRMNADDYIRRIDRMVFVSGIITILIAGSLII